MNEIKVLAKRNIKIFLRDKTAVFFSFLSIIILLSLYLLFLKNNYVVDEFVEAIGKDNMNFIISSIIMSGVLVINTFTLALGNLGSIVSDLTNNTIDGFLITPVKRYKIITAYYISSFLITLVFTLVMWVLAILFIGVQTKIWFSFTQIINVSLLLVLYTLISTSFMILLVTFISSLNAFGAISGVFGTIIGFLAGLYVPLYLLPKAVQDAASLLPFTHMTIYMKQALLNPKLNELIGMLTVEAVDYYKIGAGISDLKIFNHEVKPFWILLTTTIIAISLLVFATYRLSKKIKK